MYQPLVVCPGCARHVRNSESVCPFCTAALAEDDLARIAPDTRARMGRAAVFMFGAAVAVTACGSKDKGGTSSTTTATSTTTSSASGMGGMNALYGAAPAGAGGGGGGDASGVGGTAALYGGPPEGGAGGK